MHVVTWNVNSLKARMPRVLQLLEQHAPDVVCLQETKANPDAFPELELSTAGYDAVHTSGGRWAGVAILAKHGTPLTDPTYALAGDPVPEEARWCEATANGIRFVSVYVPNGRTLDSPEYPRKLAFLDAMATRAQQLHERSEMIICGDMNIAPDDADVYDPAAFVGGTHVSADERTRLSHIQDAGDLADAYRALHPDEVQYTWWDYRAGNFHKGLGLRIDLALVSRTITDRLQGVGIYRDYRKGQKPSDHAPLAIDLA